MARSVLLATTLDRCVWTVAEVSDVRIRMHDNIAEVTAAYHERGVLGGKPYDYHDRLTDVWMKNGGKWQLMASHYSLPANP